MSSVSPTSDSGRGIYYSKPLNEIKEEIETEAKRTREKRDEEVRDLEERYKTALLKKDEEVQETFKNLRESANESLTHERDKYQAAIDQVRDETYNKRGLTPQSSNPEYYKKIITDLEEEKDNRIAQGTKTHQEELQNLENRHRAELFKKESILDDAMRASREVSSQKEAKSREQFQSEIEKIRNQTYNNKGQVQEHRREIQDLVDASQQRHENDVANTRSIEDDFHHQNQELIRKTNHQIDDLTTSHSNEVRDYEEKIKTLNDYNRRVSQEKAEELDRMVKKENEEGPPAQHRLAESYQQETDKLKRDAQEKGSTYSRRIQEAVQAKDDHYLKTLSEQNLEHFNTVKDLQKDFQVMTEQQEHARQHDQETSENRVKNLLQSASEEKALSMGKQAKEFSEKLDANQAANEYTIERLQNSLQGQKNTSDIALISPSAEAAVRKLVAHEYEKSLNTEIEKNKITTDQMQKRYTNQIQNSLEEHQTKETQLSRESAAARSLGESRYSALIQDSEFQTRAKLQEQDAYHQREIEDYARQYGSMMERQKRDYEGILQRYQSDMDARLANSRQDAETNLRTTHRALTTRQNELIREYEKKLGDQKVESEAKVEDLKAQAQTDLRDIERQSKKDLELQAKNYEQRIAQLETQSKERERYISQTYQDELDRARRSYEIISKKKS